MHYIGGLPSVQGQRPSLGGNDLISWPHRPASMGKPAAPPLIEPNPILSKTDEGLGPGRTPRVAPVDRRSPLARRSQRCGAETCGRAARRNVSRWEVLRPCAIPFLLRHPGKLPKAPMSCPGVPECCTGGSKVTRTGQPGKVQHYGPTLPRHGSSRRERAGIPAPCDAQ